VRGLDLLEPILLRRDGGGEHILDVAAQDNFDNKV
jgi:hypothetical protein